MPCGGPRHPAPAARQRKAVRGLGDFAFDPASPAAVVRVGDEDFLEERAAETRVPLLTPRFPPGRTGGRVHHVAFPATPSVRSVVAWSNGPVAGHDAGGAVVWVVGEPGSSLPRLTVAADAAARWLADRPHDEPPWHRLRRLDAATGAVLEERRCDLGANFTLIPRRDAVLRADLSVTPIADL